MAEEAGPALSPPAPLDHHKRKHDELESEEAPESTPATEEPAGYLSLEPDGVRKDVDFTEDQVSDSFDAKRPRLDEKPDGLADENGHEVAEKENAELPEKNAEANEDHENQMAVVEQPPGEESVRDNYTNDEMHVPGNVHERPAAADDSKMEDEQPPSCTDNDQSDNALNPVQDEGLKSDVPQQRDDSAEQYLDSGSQTMSRKIEVPNNKVGVLIGKAGDTIRLLQSNSGAKIQITRDADADPRSSTRPVELVGTLESINKAESLIRDVIAEADAGGSPSLVARGFTTVVPVGDAEQIELQVPNEKVGMIIGKGGETIKSLQTRSGARIQLVPQHLPEGDRSKERTVRVSGDKKQIETARELIKEVMSQPMRPSPLSNNYNQQAYRPRGPAGPPQWGGRGPNTVQPLPYDYQQRGPHPSHNQQFLTSYGAYHSHVTPRGSFGSGWEQRPPMQGPPQSGGYDYYGQGGHMANVPASAPHSSHASGHPSMASSVGPPNSQANYNYGQPRGPDCGQSAPYSQTVAPHQGYGQGFAEPKYENQGPVQQPYGAHLSSQPGSYPDAQVYPPHQHFNRPPAYGMISQGPHSYAPSAAGQVGDASYQAPNASTQPYGQNVAPQPTYPYSSSGIAQAPYGSAPATNDGYNQPPPASGAVPAYQQQAAQPVPGYGQPVAQQVPVYAQTSAPAAAYGQYPSSQPGYSEQSAPAAATYAYQGQTDPAYAGGQAYSAAPTGQQGYAQPAPAQASYDQSAQSGSYAGNPPVGALGYGKSLSPQPQPGYPPYDSSQMYGAGR